MDPMDVPTEVTKLVYTCPLSASKAVSQEQVAVLLAHYWPAIEKHVRAQALDEAADAVSAHQEAQDEHMGGMDRAAEVLRRMADEARAAR